VRFDTLIFETQKLLLKLLLCIIAVMTFIHSFGCGISCDLVSKGFLADVSSACRVMMLFLLERLQHQREACSGTISKVSAIERFSSKY